MPKKAEITSYYLAIPVQREIEYEQVLRTGLNYNSEIRYKKIVFFS